MDDLKAPGKGEDITASFLQSLTQKVNLLWKMKVYGAKFDATEGGVALTVPAKAQSDLPDMEILRLVVVRNNKAGYVDALVLSDFTELDE